MALLEVIGALLPRMKSRCLHMLSQSAKAGVEGNHAMTCLAMTHSHESCTQDLRRTTASSTMVSDRCATDLGVRVKLVCSVCRHSAFRAGC